MLLLSLSELWIPLLPVVQPKLGRPVYFIILFVINIILRFNPSTINKHLSESFLSTMAHCSEAFALASKVRVACAPTKAAVVGAVAEMKHYMLQCVTSPFVAWINAEWFADYLDLRTSYNSIELVPHKLVAASEDHSYVDEFLTELAPHLVILQLGNDEVYDQQFSSTTIVRQLFHHIEEMWSKCGVKHFCIIGAVSWQPGCFTPDEFTTRLKSLNFNIRKQHAKSPLSDIITFQEITCLYVAEDVALQQFLVNLHDCLEEEYVPTRRLVSRN